MRWIAATVSVVTDEPSVDGVAEMLADQFYCLGLKGVVINDAPADGDGRTRVAVTGYFPGNESFPENRSLLESSVGRLSAAGMSGCSVNYEELDEADWAESWKAHFYPQKIGQHIVVKPTWRDYGRKPGDLVIEIDPGMAFGTGTHATTRMCLIMLERYFQKGMTFLDVGTGSGILMVAAFLMGADKVRGVDNDPVAVDVARANLSLNRVPPEQAMVNTADLTSGVTGPFDMIGANILAEVVAELIPSVKQVLAPDGLFFCSGIIDKKRHLVTEQLDRFGFRIIDQIKDEEWVCLVAG